MNSTLRPYELTFIAQPRMYLYARVKAETASPEIIFGYLQEIIKKCDETGFDRVLVEREILGTLSDSDAFLTGTDLLRKGIGQLKIALVDVRSENAEGLDFATLMLNNRGATIRLFSNLRDAEMWLKSP